MVRCFRFTAVLVLSAILSTATHAQFSFHAVLDGPQAGNTEVGTGTAFGTFSPDFKTLTYQVTVSKLTGPITGSHFHIAPSGSVVHPITFVGNTSVGTWTNIPDSLVKYFIKGNFYLNVHTTAHPGGEIHGKVIPQQFMFTVALDGTQASTTSAATGTGYVFLADTTGNGVPNALVYSVTIAGLSANLTGSHFHTLPSGSIVHPITFKDSTSAGVWTGYPDSILTLLMHGKLYVNVHSTAFPGGEIRGAVVPVGELPFVAAIDGIQSGTPSLARGTAYAILSADMTSIRYAATYARLSAALTGSHFHTSTNGGIIQPVTFASNTTSGTWTGFSDINLQDLLRGRVYMNIHSTTYPAGEIRGALKYFDGTFTTRLSGADEPTSSPATGTAWLHFGATTDTSFYQVTCANLVDVYSGSHFHIAPQGSVVKPIVTVDSSTGSGFWAMPDTAVVALLRKNVYVNIHSKTYPAGEIRGTMTFGPNVVSAVSQAPGALPRFYALEQNYPNPFNPSTIIRYTLSQPDLVRLTVYNMLGQEVATLVDEVRPAGTYTVSFNAASLASGVYLYQLSTRNGVLLSKKMLLLK